MRWLRPRSAVYLHDPPISRIETFGAVVFLLAFVVVVAKVASWQFDQVLGIAAVVGLVLLALTRHKLVYVGAATAWTALRLLAAAARHRDTRALAWAIGLGAATWLLVSLARRRERRETVIRRWD